MIELKFLIQLGAFVQILDFGTFVDDTSVADDIILLRWLGIMYNKTFDFQDIIRIQWYYFNRWPDPSQCNNFVVYHIKDYNWTGPLFIRVALL